MKKKKKSRYSLTSSAGTRVRIVCDAIVVEFLFKVALVSLCHLYPSTRQKSNVFMCFGLAMIRECSR